MILFNTVIKVGTLPDPDRWFKERFTLNADDKQLMSGWIKA